MPDEVALKNELARLRAHAHVHDACVVLYEAWSNLPNRQLQAQVAGILTDLNRIESCLSDLKVLM